MSIQFAGREVLVRVKVYWNRKTKLWSVMNRASRRVEFRSSQVQLENVRFVMSLTGRERVLKTDRRNIHAFAEGELVGLNREVVMSKNPLVQVQYNPFRGPDFVELLTGTKVTGVSRCWFVGSKVFIEQVELGVKLVG